MITTAPNVTEIKTIITCHQRMSEFALNKDSQNYSKGLKPFRNQAVSKMIKLYMI
jgi:hypothetical protein